MRRESNGRESQGEESQGGATVGIRPFTQSLPMALQRAREATMREFRPMLAEHDLTEQQWRVLRALAAAEGPLDVGSVADRTFLLSPSLTRILTNLEQRRLVERERAHGDQRRSNISLAPDGWAIVTRVAPQSEAIYARIEQRYGPRKLTALLAELERLAALDLSTGDDSELNTLNEGLAS